MPGGLRPSFFWDNVLFGDDCWEWQGHRNKRSGHGQRRHEGRVQGAHVVAWQLCFGPIPPGRYVCHHCDNPPCVRPDHLFLGTQSDNVNDMVAKGRHWADNKPRHTHCKHGHELTEANTYRYIKNGRPQTTCRLCMYESTRRTRARKKALRSV